MHEAVFRIDHESVYADATARVDASIDMWCGGHADLLHVTGDDRYAARDLIDEEVGITEWIDHGYESLAVTHGCLLHLQEGLLEEYLRRHDCLTFYPTSYDNGAILTRVISLKSENLTAMYRDLTDEFPVEVEAKREIGTVEDAPLMVFDAELPTFSERQRTVLTLAHERGYYEIPKGVTTEELAADLDISRRTLEEHLRRAEQKLVEAFLAFMHW
jgi:hypothetical protein